MRKYILALLVAVVSVSGAYAQVNGGGVSTNDHLIGYAHAQFVQKCDSDGKNCVSTPSAPAPLTYDATGTVVSGGSIASQIIEWVVASFGTAIAALLTALVYRLLGYAGIQVSQAQRDQLQAIVVNGINTAATKAEAGLQANQAMSIDVKNRVIAEAVSYVQTHGADTIKALGLDPQSGQAVEAIRARIATALADPRAPTDAKIPGSAS